MKSDNQIFNAWLIMSLVFALDIAITIMSFSFGFHEVNPIANTFFKLGWFGFVLFFVFGTALYYIVFTFVWNILKLFCPKTKEFYFWFVVFISIGLEVFVIVRNVWRIVTNF